VEAVEVRASLMFTFALLNFSTLQLTMTDTGIGGSRRAYPTTRRSAIVAIRSGDAESRRRALDAVAAAYWKPVYTTIRIRWQRSNEDAKDLTQAFFVRATERDLFASYDPEKGTFRTFVRTCLDRFLANEVKAEGRLKRGGGTISQSIDDGSQPLRDDLVANPEAVFHREWVRGMFEVAVDRFAEECRVGGNDVRFAIFETYDLDEHPDGRPRYAELASRHGLPVTTVTNHLSWARRRFREVTLELLREMTASDDEFRAEARALLGIDPG